MTNGEEDGHRHRTSQIAKVLGDDPESGQAEVTLRKGPFGIYLQLGEVEQAMEKPKIRKSGKKSKAKPKLKTIKPKRGSLLKTLPPEDLDLRFALALLALPRERDASTRTSKVITAGIGRYGPYVKHGSTYRLADRRATTS